MDQTIRIMVAGKSHARYAKMISGLTDVDVSSVDLPHFSANLPKDSKLMPHLFVLVLSEIWEDEIKIFLSVFGATLPSVIVIGPGLNPRLMRKAMQAGAKDYLEADAGKPEFRASVKQQVKLIRSNRVSIDNQMVVSISPKGSSESAFLMSNLAYINAAHRERSTAAMDLDLQFGSIPMYLDLTLKRSVLQALNDSETLDSGALEAHMTQHKSGLYVGGAFVDDMVLPGEVPVENLDQLLKILNSSFQRVFINLPMIISPLTSLVLSRANKVIIVVEQDIICLRNAKTLMTTLRDDIEIAGGKLYIVINRYEKNHQITRGDIEKTLGGAATYIIPEDPSTVYESINTGEPLFKLAPKSPVTQHLINIAQALNGEKFKRRPGILGKMFSRGNRH